MSEQSGTAQSVLEAMRAEARLSSGAGLEGLNTFGVAATAAHLADIRAPEELPALLSAPEFAGLERLVLGGGSNILFTDDFPGLVLLINHGGIQVAPLDEHRDRVSVAAGENWDRFVRWSLAQGYCGLENLILIPGSVGAAPIQNIGAYGTEVAAFIESVRAWDGEAGVFRRLAHDECLFAYRDSIFKRERGRFIVTEVVFRLSRQRPLTLGYAGIREALDEMGVASPTATDVGRAVESLRRRKLPDPARLGNAGSFFKNPLVGAEAAEALRQRHPALPVFALEDGRCKLSAAWLIEHCGFKGHRQGAAGIAEQHALVLVNHGGASGAELLALAERIQAAVAAEFDLQLEPEPLIV